MRTDTQAQIDDSAISPVFARTYTVDQTTSPSLYECVRLVVVRSGSAILSTKAGKIAVGEGNVILIGPNAKCGYSPESNPVSLPPLSSSILSTSSTRSFGNSPVPSDAAKMHMEWQQRHSSTPFTRWALANIGLDCLHRGLTNWFR